MGRRRLRRECRARLADFQIPQPFTVEALCAQVSRSRGRDLYLHPLPYVSAPNMPCGMWVSTQDADHVFHARGVSALHQRNIILHEIGHILCDHSVGNDSGLTALLTDLDPAMVQRVLQRSRYSTPQEQQAEMMAALIVEQAGWAHAQRPTGGPLGDLFDLFGQSRDG